MKKFTPPPRIIRGIVLVFIFFVTGCNQDLIQEKIELDRIDLEEVLNRSNDFGSFIHLHLENRKAIAALSESDSVKLQYYFSELEKKNKIDFKESGIFLKEIGFRDEALQFLQSTINHLNSDYSFMKKDLIEIIDARIRFEYKMDLVSNQRSGSLIWWLVTCDGFCTMDSIIAWPAAEGIDYHKFRSIHYAGCMNGCKNGPNQ